MIVPHSTMETHTVRQIDFGLLNPEEIVNILFNSLTIQSLGENVSLQGRQTHGGRPGG
jgi:hypothetical protein